MGGMKCAGVCVRSTRGCWRARRRRPVSNLAHPHGLEWAGSPLPAAGVEAGMGPVGGAWSQLRSLGFKVPNPPAGRSLGRVSGGGHPGVVGMAALSSPLAAAALGAGTHRLHAAASPLVRCPCGPRHWWASIALSSGRAPILACAAAQAAMGCRAWTLPGWAGDGVCPTGSLVAFLWLPLGWPCFCNGR